MIEHRHAKTGNPAKIAREAELLGRARHPGVADLLGIEGDPREPVLVTRRVEGRILSELSELSRAEVGGVTVAVASTLAEVHQLGVVHGAVAPEHVILGPGGRPVLCGFGYGGRVGASSPARPSIAEEFIDPGRADEVPLDPSVDVYGLGAVLRSLVEGSSFSRADQLLRVADDATHPDVARRPTASQVAAAISAAVPDARLPGAPSDDSGIGPALGSHRPETGGGAGARPRRLTTGRTPTQAGAGALEALRRSQPGPKGRGRRASSGWRAKSRRRRPTVMAAIGAAAGLVVLVPAGRGLLGSGDKAATPVVESALPMATTSPPGRIPKTSVAATGAAPEAPATPITAPPGEATTVPTTTSSPAVRSEAPPSSARADCPVVEGSLVADTDGDGCPETLHYAGGIVESALARWSVGVDGDQVATGDWMCRGEAVLALLHPPTGDVFVFGGWAPPDHDLVATAAARVSGGFALRATQLGDGGCQGLVVDRRDGAPVAVPIGAGE